MKLKRVLALLLASVILLLCLSGCSESDYLLSKSQLDEMLADAKAEGYNEGYEDGCNEIEDKYSNDYDSGYSDGYDRGRSDTVDQYERKVKDAYSDGYNEGVSDGASFDADAVWKDGYDYGYNYGVSTSGTSSGYTEKQSEPTAAVAMPQPEIQEAKAPAPQQETAPTAATYDYIINTNTGKFHYNWCKSVGKMAEKNKWYYTGTRDSVINMGYVPCKNCNP